MRKAFKLQDLDCANCAAKMEADINDLDGVSKATVNFLTQKLMIDADVPDAASFGTIVDQAQQICSKYEPDCLILR
ncbi:cation transporter [Adlercreutzia sp. ZJ242]|uniref:cation transporter n=1 Tax=Adlercreutzia sp. ZJ242 TaxID=2709409 RepID=UPI0013EAE194|nr:cation transporter [Adlercreutzia sp. ZJ242]